VASVDFVPVPVKDRGGGSVALPVVVMGEPEEADMMTEDTKKEDNERKRKLTS
jgi:hypothetical protein